ncbi:DUF4354 family protein [Klebsiella oxytoca]|uniref:DUF4354 family protein n=1 Tax=Klebsiella oxytoca TaxID=571 RepID=UPI001CCABA55|nr:DUF4354 family protein [Klebsiella oxytoca]MBZ7707232.1 DUF4354 family protein [Klebsiella oxytoca]
MFSRKIKIFSLYLSLMAAGQAISAVKSPDVTVYAQKEGAGSVWNSVTGKAEHLLSYQVTVNNNSSEPLVPGKDNKMCFYLDDNMGKTLMGHGIQLELLSPYKPGESRTGVIYFSSTEPDMLSLPYVKLGLGSQCK